jgi:hypothetical protein
MSSSAIKRLIDSCVFGSDDRAQSKNRFWLYIGFSIFFLASLVAVSVIKRGA